MTLDDAELKRLITEHDLGLSDARIVLASVFRLASSQGGSLTVEYASEGWPPDLSVRYTPDGELDSVHLAPDLDDATRDALLMAFTAQRPKRVFTFAFFANVPITGWLRYRDLFQILPMPERAPSTTEVFGPHPFIVEVTYEGAERESDLDAYRGAVASRTVGRLLTGLLRGTEDRLGQFPTRDWVVIEESEELRTQFEWIGYYLDGVPSVHDTLTPPPTGLPPLRQIPAAQFYERSHAVSSQDVLEVPDSFEHLLDSFFRLNSDDSLKLLRWCHWLNHSQQVIRLSASAAYIAAVQAVEALMPPGPGPSRGFRDFIETHAPGTSLAAERTEFYRLRSALSHGGQLVTGELLELAFYDFAPHAWSQRDTLFRIQSIARLAGTNWLLGASSSN